MSLPIVLIVIVSIMSIFAFAIFIIAKKSNFSTQQTIDTKPIRAFKNGEQEIK
ncbi:hypothetical protein [Solibacillus sp. FSL H8-0538]|uniref:hypothetical protein n=1 Tax=Solibacillus sp. FSL H8-0538 TaxID=2921400 RepID=UPI0030F7DEED